MKISIWHWPVLTQVDAAYNMILRSKVVASIGGGGGGGGLGPIEDVQCSNTADIVHYPTDVQATGQEWLEYLRHRLLGYNIPTYYPTAPNRAQITRPSSKNIL